MSGPNSAPNGDRSLTDNTVVFCKKCGDKEDGFYVRKRKHLAEHGKLVTGKTGR